jgi:hypothetical protein
MIFGAKLGFDDGTLDEKKGAASASCTFKATRCSTHCRESACACNHCVDAENNDVSALDEFVASAARILLKQDAPEELPRIAIHALEQGLESSALIELAGMNAPLWRDTEEVFRAALRELGLPALTEAHAVHILALPIARDLAERFLGGRCSTAEAIERLNELHSTYAHRGFMNDVCALCDEYACSEKETGPEWRDQFDARLRAALEGILGIPLFDVKQPGSSDPSLFASIY